MTCLKSKQSKGKQYRITHWVLNNEWSGKKERETECLTTAKSKPKIEFLLQTFPVQILTVLFPLFVPSLRTIFYKCMRTMRKIGRIFGRCDWPQSWIHIFRIPFSVNCHLYGTKCLQTHTHTFIYSLTHSVKFETETWPTASLS